MRTARIVSFVGLMLVSWLPRTASGESAPIWRKQYALNVESKIIEGGRVVTRRQLPCVTDSGEEVRVAIGEEVLIGKGEEVGKQTFASELSVLASSVGEGLFKMVCHVALNVVGEVNSDILSVARKSYEVSYLARAGEERTVVDLGKGHGPGDKVTITVSGAKEVGWVNVTPVSVAGESLSAQQVLETICGQVGLHLALDRMSADVKEKISQKGTLSLTDVPFHRSLNAVSQYYGVVASYSKDEGTCEVVAVVKKR